MKLWISRFKVCVPSIWAWYSFCAFHFITACPSRDSQCGTLFLDTQTHLWGLTLQVQKGVKFCWHQHIIWVPQGFLQNCQKGYCHLPSFLQQVLCWGISLFLHFKVCFLPNLVRNSRRRSLLYAFLWKLIPVIKGGMCSLEHGSHLVILSTLQAFLWCS